MQTPGCHRFEGRGSLVGYWPEPFHINWRPQGDSSPFPWSDSSAPRPTDQV